ncbi:hypothetical protein MTO96_051189 [Rhipicephalus appendiculatus]
MDSKLAHLLEAKNGLLSRWRTQRLNRRLRARISLLMKEIEAQAKKLGRQQWMEKCNDTDSRMRRSSRWRLLMSLLNDKESRGAACLATDRIIRKQLHMGITDAQVAHDFATQYLPLRRGNVTGVRVLREYGGCGQAGA